MRKIRYLVKKTTVFVIALVLLLNTVPVTGYSEETGESIQSSNVNAQGETTGETSVGETTAETGTTDAGIADETTGGTATGEGTDVEGSSEGTTAETGTDEGATTETGTDEGATTETGTGDETTTETSTDGETDDVALDEETDGDTLTDGDAKPDSVLELCDVFPGLSDDIELSTAQMEDKEELSEYIDEVCNAEEGEDYEENEIVVEAPDYETALKYAEAFNGILEEYFGGMALISLSKAKIDESEYEEISPEVSKCSGMVEMAVLASADEDIQLPAAWPNYYAELMSTASGPEYDDPYLLDSSERYQWHHAFLETNAAWRAGITGQGVKVAVIDSGANMSHNDLVIEASSAFHGSGSSKEDINGHGSHVAGIIGAKKNNDIGGCGIAPDCTLYTARITDDTNSITSYNIFRAIYQSYHNWKADIINMSIGMNSYVSYLDGVIEDAYNNGTLCICSAGNYGVGTEVYPGAYKYAVSVAGVDETGALAYYNNDSASNYSSTVRYGAPSTDIWSTYTGSADRYVRTSGTSMASPCVAGVAALILSSGKITAEGHAKCDQLLKIMDAGCVKESSYIGKGNISVAKALGLTSDTAAPTIPVPDIPAGTYYEETLNISLSNENSEAVYKDKFYYSLDGKGITYKNGVLSANAVEYVPGEPIQITGKSQVILNVMAVKLSNGLSSKSKGYKYVLKPYVRKINILTDGNVSVVKLGSSIRLKADIEPSYAANKGVGWQITDIPSGTGTPAKIDKSGLFTTGKNTRPGVYTVSCYAKDGSGVSEVRDIEVIGSNVKVTSIKPKSTNIVAYAGVDTLCDVVLKITENGVTSQALTEDYSQWSSANISIADVSIVGDELKIRGGKVGKTTITGISTDGTGRKTQITVNVKQHPESVSIQPILGDAVSVGTSVSMTASVLPANTTNKKVSWSVVEYPAEYNPKYKVSIGASNGKLSVNKLAATGTYKIRVTSVDVNNEGVSVSDEYSFNVTNDRVEKIDIDTSKVTVFRTTNIFGAPTEEEVCVYLTGGSYSSLKTVVKNTGLVTASLDEYGYLKIKSTGRAVGKTEVWLESTDGTSKKKKISVEVINSAATMSCSVPSGRSDRIAVGASLKLKTSFYESNGSIPANSKKLYWESSDPSIVSVNQSGVAVAKSDSGYATITATTKDGSNLTCSVNLYTVPKIKKTVMENVDDIALGANGYATVSYQYNDANGGSNEIWKYTTEVKVDKPGLSVNWDVNGTDYTKLKLYGNKIGTYKVTLTMKDGSGVKREFKVKVR